MNRTSRLQKKTALLIADRTLRAAARDGSNWATPWAWHQPVGALARQPRVLSLVHQQLIARIAVDRAPGGHCETGRQNSLRQVSQSRIDRIRFQSQDREHRLVHPP